MLFLRATPEGFLSQEPTERYEALNKGKTGKKRTENSQKTHVRGGVVSDLRLWLEVNVSAGCPLGLVNSSLIQSLDDKWKQNFLIALNL